MCLTVCWVNSWQIPSKAEQYSERTASEGGTPKQNYFHQHFLSENHHGLLEDCEIIRLIDKTDLSDPTRREFFWMQKLNTLVALGLNLVEVVSKKFFSYYCKAQSCFYSVATFSSPRSVSATAGYFTVLSRFMTCFPCKNHYIICSELLYHYKMDIAWSKNKLKKTEVETFLNDVYSVMVIYI